MNLRLLGLVKVEFKLFVREGLLIRSGKGREVLGGVDIQPVSIHYPYAVGGRHYVLEVPYIPGSSLKGRARSLLEVALGLPLHTTDNKIYMHMRVAGREIVHLDPYCPVDNVFGSASVQPQQLAEGELGWILRCWAPSRAIFYDLVPTEDYVSRLCEEKGGCGLVTFSDFLEEKYENRIDRVTSAADPRNILRVKPGVEFRGAVAFQIFDLDVCRRKECDEHSDGFLKEVEKFGSPAAYYFTQLVNALRLVEETYLGAAGTRGYGKVEFRNVKVTILDVPQLGVRFEREWVSLKDLKVEEVRSEISKFKC